MAKTDFSEATYAFALTENLVRELPVRGVPIFPSRRAEGGLEGGYDVEIPTFPVPLLLQFKVPVVLTKQSHLMPPDFECPYYRMALRTGTPDQHAALLRHQRRGHLALYATPAFHDSNALNRHYRAGQMILNSRFFRPADIGDLDHESHFVAYESEQAVDWWIFSEPVRKEVDSSSEALISDVLVAVEKVEEPAPPIDFFRRVSAELAETLGEEKIEEIASVSMPPREDSGTRVVREARRAAALARFGLNAELIVVGRDERQGDDPQGRVG